MSIEFMHVPDTRLQRRGEVASVVDDSYGMSRVKLLEGTCFRQLLIDRPTGIFTNMEIAAKVARSTSSLGLTLTHQAGILDPAVAARQLSDLDRLSDGHLSVRVFPCLGTSPNGGSRSPRNHQESYQQTDEYLVLLKRLWSNERPFDHEGPFYSVKAGHVANKGPRGAGIQIRMGGISGTALSIAARHADIFELTPGSPEETSKLIERMHVAAAQYGRVGKIRFAMPIRVDPVRQQNVCERGAAFDSTTKNFQVFGLSEQIGEVLRAYASVGVVEFMVEGLDDRTSLVEFSNEFTQLYEPSTLSLDPLGVTLRNAAIRRIPKLRH